MRNKFSNNANEFWLRFAFHNVNFSFHLSWYKLRATRLSSWSSAKKQPGLKLRIRRNPPFQAFISLGIVTDFCNRKWKRPVIRILPFILLLSRLYHQPLPQSYTWGNFLLYLCHIGLHSRNQTYLDPDPAHSNLLLPRRQLTDVQN